MKATHRLRENAVLLLCITFVIIMAIVKPSFVTITNLKNVLIDASIYGVSALAMTHRHHYRRV